MGILADFVTTSLTTLTDVLPIAVIIFGFQLLVLRQPVPKLKSVLIGFIYVLVGLTLFLVGLQEALFPIGRTMARQLTEHAIPGTAQDVLPAVQQWHDYLWVYLFAAAIGFSTTTCFP